MKKILFLIAIVIAFASCTSESGKRAKAAATESDSVKLIRVEVYAYLDGNIIADDSYIVSGTNKVIDRIIAKESAKLTGSVVCDSVNVYKNITRRAF